MSQETETFEIILGRVEHINASHFNGLSFTKPSDIYILGKRLSFPIDKISMTN